MTVKQQLGRNDPCWCGSGRKYKRCCLNGERQTPTLDTARPDVTDAARSMDRLLRKLGFGAQLADVWVVGEVEFECPGVLEGLVATALDGLIATAGRNRIEDDTAARVDALPGTLKRAGVEALGMGSNRVCVPFVDGWAAKLSWTPVGITHNLYEASAWLAAEDAAARRLAPCAAITRGGALIVRRGEPLTEPLTPDTLKARDQRRAAYERYVEETGDQTGGDAGVPVEYQHCVLGSNWEPQVHRLRERIGEPAKRDPRLDNYGLVDGRLVALEWKPAGIAGTLITAGQWLQYQAQHNVPEGGLLTLNRDELRPRLRKLLEHVEHLRPKEETVNGR